jgi:hypothetical protein
MKLKPITLFVLLLAILVVCVLLANLLQVAQAEGFVSFYQSSAPSPPLINIPQYNDATNVFKLYDNIFFDTGNSNLIEVDSTAYTGNVDLTGSTISKVYVSPRPTSTAFQTLIYNVNTGISQTSNVRASFITGITDSYISGKYNSNCANTDKYTLFYIPYGEKTVLHMINMSNKTNIGTFYNNTMNTYKYYYAPNAATGPFSPIQMTEFSPSNSAKNNELSTIANYDQAKTVCQVVPNVFVDLSNHHLILQNTAGELSVYDRLNNQKFSRLNTPGKITGTSGEPEQISMSSWTPWQILDTVGQTTVLYVPISATQTVVAAYQYTSAAKTDVTFLNVCRFDKNGMVGGNDEERQPGSRYAPPTGNTASYFNQFWQNQNSGSADPNSFTNLNDYMLKTQIVPPVCPACPACPASSSSACTNCGGQGGCGTLAARGNTVVSVVQSPSSPTQINDRGNSVGGVLNNTVDTAGDVLEKTVDTVGDVAGGVAVGAGALAGGVVAGAGSVIGGAGNVVGEVVGGAENIATSAITGVSNILSSGQGQGQAQVGEKQPGQNNRNSYLMTPGTQNQYNDPYSYYGQLPAKGPAQFMPVTADFSAFAK